MKSYVLLLIRVFAMTILGCTCNESKEVTPSVIVLCDVSNSTTLRTSSNETKGRLEKLKDYVDRIPRWYSLKSKIYFFPVSSSLVSEEMAAPICFNVQTNSQVKAEKKRNDSLKKVVRTTMDTLAEKSPSSCILFSIKRAIDLFTEWKNESSGNSHTYHLVIVSDMLESCRLNDTTEVHTTAENTARLTAALNSFQASNPQLNVSDLDLTVRIMINSPWMGRQLEMVRAAWRDWFLKIGVDAKKIKIATEPPEDIDDPVVHNLGL